MKNLRVNIQIYGGTASGKSTLHRLLKSAIEEAGYNIKTDISDPLEDGHGIKHNSLHFNEVTSNTNLVLQISEFQTMRTPLKDEVVVSAEEPSAEEYVKSIHPDATCVKSKDYRNDDLDIFWIYYADRPHCYGSTGPEAWEKCKELCLMLKEYGMLHSQLTSLKK